MNKIAQIFETLGGGRSLALSAVSLSALIATSIPTAAGVGITDDVASFLIEQFESIGATVAAQNVPGSSCTSVEIDTTKAIASLQTCSVDLGCGSLVAVPVWHLWDGSMVFGADSVETIVAVDCPAAIPDPEKRDRVVKLVEKQMGVGLQ